MINFMHVMNTVFILMKYSHYIKIDAVAKPITSEIKLNYVELVHQPPYQWIMLPKQMTWNPLGSHKYHDGNPNIRETRM